VAIQVILHLHNEDPFMGDMDALPDPTHSYIRITNPRKRDGKSLNTLTNGATSFLYPWTRITFLEILGEEEETAQTETLMSFFRENGSGRR
jgi:hypothetical protein